MEHHNTLQVIPCAQKPSSTQSGLSKKVSCFSGRKGIVTGFCVNKKSDLRKTHRAPPNMSFIAVSSLDFATSAATFQEVLEPAHATMNVLVGLISESDCSKALAYHVADIMSDGLLLPTNRHYGGENAPTTATTIAQLCFSSSSKCQHMTSVTRPHRR